jgi:hypothetical protein
MQAVPDDLRRRAETVCPQEIQILNVQNER